MKIKLAKPTDLFDLDFYEERCYLVEDIEAERESIAKEIREIAEQTKDSMAKCHPYITEQLSSLADTLEKKER